MSNKKLLSSRIKFSNGASFECRVLKRIPKLARDGNDYIRLIISPEKGRGDEGTYYMNIYDANNLIWLLTNAILQAHESGILALPKKL